MTLYIYFNVNGINVEDFVKALYAAGDHFKKQKNNEIQA
nr:MAG TPA: 50S ribosomal protein L19 [Caudoviricetes sp.]